ncbi:MAG: carboxypeptidase-like regulatory domain-containing protein [Gemmataceae bacterium]
MRPDTPFHWTAILALTVALVGCAGGKRLYPVEGTVLFDDGKPATSLAKGTVSLESIEDKSNASGQIQADGTFRIRSPLGQDGVPAGTYRVVVLPPEGADRNRPPVDRRYGRYETSGIEITVKDEPNKVTITVQRPK